MRDFKREKCVGCGRPMGVDPRDKVIAPQSIQDPTRCKTCVSAGDLIPKEEDNNG